MTEPADTESGDQRSRARQLRPVLVLLAGSLLLLVLLFGAGFDLPGPKVREIFGLAKGRQPVYPCVPSARGNGTPGQPPPPDQHWRGEPGARARDELRAVTLDGRIYLATGHDDKVRSITKMDVFDPVRKRYTTAPDTPKPVDHALLVTHGGALYLTGGFTNLVARRTDGKPTRSMWRYSPHSKRWKAIEPMPAPRWGHTGAVIGDKLYVVGGLYGNEDQLVREMAIYDFKTGKWSKGPDIPTPRHHVEAVALDGRLYVVGGREPGDYSLDNFERFDPQTNKWHKLPPLPYGSGGPAAVAAGGEVIVIGGGDDKQGWVTGATWAYSPATGKWRRLPDLSVPRHGLAAAVANGRIYAFAGSPCALFGLSGKVESLPIR